MIAVTGATGFLGGHLIRELQRRNVAFRAVSRRGMQGVPSACADLADPAALAEAFAGCDAVVANAAMVSFGGTLDDSLRTNVGGTENTLRAAAAAGVRRVVYVSTVALYRTVLRHPMREDHPRYGRKRRLSWIDFSTDWRYAISKQAAEERAWELAEELGIALTAVRPGPIYGSGDTKWTLQLAKAGRRFSVAPTVGVPAIHAGDVAAAIAVALDRPSTAGQAFNLAGPPVSLATFHREAARHLGGRVLPIPVPGAWVAYDTTAAEKDLDLRIRPVEEGIAEAMAEHRSVPG